MIYGGYKPLIDNKSNFNTFQNRYIVDPRREHEELTVANINKMNASPLSKMLSKHFLKIHPKLIDHYIKGQFGYHGKMVLNLSKYGTDEAKFMPYSLGKTGLSLMDLGIFKPSGAFNSDYAHRIKELSLKKNLTGNEPIFDEMKRLTQQYFSYPSAKRREWYNDLYRDEIRRVREILESVDEETIKLREQIPDFQSEEYFKREVETKNVQTKASSTREKARNRKIKGNIKNK